MGEVLRREYHYCLNGIIKGIEPFYGVHQQRLAGQQQELLRERRLHPPPASAGNYDTILFHFLLSPPYQPHSCKHDGVLLLHIKIPLYASFRCFGKLLRMNPEFCNSHKVGKVVVYILAYHLKRLIQF